MYFKTLKIIFQLLSGIKNFNNIKSYLLNSQRQPPSLKKISTRAKYNSTPKKYAVSKCGNSRCVLFKDMTSISIKCDKTFYVNERCPVNLKTCYMYYV